MKIPNHIKTSLASLFQKIEDCGHSIDPFVYDIFSDIRSLLSSLIEELDEKEDHYD